MVVICRKFFSIIILDAVRVVSFSPLEHLSGSKFALRTQLSRERKSCLASFMGSFVFEDVSKSGDAVLCNVVGSTVNLTVSILDGFRVIGSVAIQLVAWTVMNLSESLLHCRNTRFCSVSRPFCWHSNCLQFWVCKCRRNCCIRGFFVPF